MKKIAIITMILGVFLTGCASTHEVIKSGVEASQYDVRNVEQLREMAKNLLSTWPMYSGIIIGAFGDRLSTELPASALDAMVMLDKIADDAKKGDLTDRQLGFSLGLRVKIAFSVVQEAIRQYAPEVFKLLPALL